MSFSLSLRDSNGRFTSHHTLLNALAMRVGGALLSVAVEKASSYAFDWSVAYLKDRKDRKDRENTPTRGAA